MILDDIKTYTEILNDTIETLKLDLTLGHNLDLQSVDDHVYHILQTTYAMRQKLKEAQE